jgi:hypothetical protein
MEPIPAEQVHPILFGEFRFQKRMPVSANMNQIRSTKKIVVKVHMLGLKLKQTYLNSKLFLNFQN